MYLLSILAVLVIISMVPTVLSQVPDIDPCTKQKTTQCYSVPAWIKNNAGWWSDGLIDDNSFVSGIQWLILKDLITIPSTQQGAGDGDNVIPDWVKNTAGWWAEDKIQDVTFVAGIKFLINEGIMIVGQVEQAEEAEEVAECTFKGIPVPCPDKKEVAEINDFYMEVNGGSCDQCKGWAYVGGNYIFQIETLDKKRGSSIDGVAITAKIVSKDGTFRHNFGTIGTEDGIYKGSITIPSLDWYADNILSVTGEYNGVEKIIEKPFTVFTQRGYSAEPASSEAAQNSGGSCTEVSPLAINSKIGWPGYTFTNGEGNPQGLAFSEDGTKMFVVGRQNDTVYEYILGGSISNSTADVNDIDNDGNTTELIAKTFSFPGPYCLGTAHKIAAMNFAPHASEGGANGIAFSTNGTKMFIVGNDRDRVYEYRLTVPFATNGTGTGYGTSHHSTFIGDYNLNSQDTDVQGIAFSANGTRMFLLGTQNNSVYEYKLAAPFGLTTTVYLDISLDVDATVTAVGGKNENSPTGIAFSNDGLKMFIVGDERNSVHEYKLATNFGLSTASYVDSFDCSNEETSPRDVAFDYSGRYMFILGKNNDDVTVYKLSEPFDISTAVVQS